MCLQCDTEPWYVKHWWEKERQEGFRLVGCARLTALAPGHAV